MCSIIEELENAAMEYGEKKGRKQGIEQGIEQGISKRNRDIAKEMKTNNEPIAKITKYTGLSAKAIQAL